ncbi:DUF2007 domain-containing protein [bacterium]|nr:DUF2007 domain-containing protein [FCB group bacterium]MBL7190215.1 DUF2007 domain-containing protein [bacterium]
MTEKETKWVALHDLPGKLYADMVKEALENRGIPCIVRSLFGSGGLGVISGAGAVGFRDRIMVPEEYFEEAQQILTDMMDHI